MKIKSLVIAMSLAAGFVGMSSAQVTMRSQQHFHWRELAPGHWPGRVRT